MSVQSENVLSFKNGKIVVNGGQTSASATKPESARPELNINIGESLLALFIIAVMVFIAGSFVMGHNLQSRIKLAAKALGDDYFETGIPNSVWKNYANSFYEYERLVIALAKTGDFSRKNVKKFVDRFASSNKNSNINDEDEDEMFLTDRHFSTDQNRPGIMGYNQTGRDGGYYQSRIFDSSSHNND